MFLCAYKCVNVCVRMHVHACVCVCVCMYVWWWLVLGFVNWWCNCSFQHGHWLFTSFRFSLKIRKQQADVEKTSIKTWKCVSFCCDWSTHDAFLKWCLCICLPIYLPICLCIGLSVYLSVYLPLSDSVISIHVHAKRTGWKTRPQPKTVILKGKNENRKDSLSLSLSLYIYIYIERERCKCVCFVMFGKLNGLPNLNKCSS